jgi:glucokinase/fructokinase
MPGGLWFLGVDVGGTWVRLIAARPGGERLQAAPAPTPDSYGDLLATIAEMVPPEARGRVAGATCGVPGSCDLERPVFVPALPWVEGEPLAAGLSAILQAPVRLGTDGHLTLLAEVGEGVAAGVRSAALVAVGTGIGGALMVDGKIWRGHSGSAGSWGWLPADGLAPSGGHGPLERAASGSALSEMARAVVPNWRGPELVEAARSGDAAALAALGEYARRLARGVAAIASAIDPEVVVIGGGLSAAMDVLGPLLAPHVEALASPDGGRVPVRPAALGPAGGAVGALLDAQQPCEP